MALGPIHEAEEFFHDRQIATVESAVKRQQIQYKLFAVNPQFGA
mgnify:CR=1 FL=1